MVHTGTHSRKANRREQAGEATCESEESFSVAFEHAPIGMALVSPDGRWLKVNQTLCDLLGYSEEELLDRTVQSITPPGEIEVSRETTRRLVTGEVWSCELQKHYVHQRGHLIPVSVNISLVRDGHGLPRYFIAQIQDITERERTESALLESKRFLQATLDALSSHIAILDEHGVIVEVNAAWARFASRNGFKGGRRGVGDNYLEICDAAAANSSEDALAVARGIRAVMAGQSDEFQFEYPCHGPRARRWFLVHVTRFGGDGPVRVVVSHENITAIKQAELARNESQQRYRSLFENMSEGYAYCQLLYEANRATDYVYLEVNSTFGPLTGLEDVVGKKVSEVVPGMHAGNPEQLEIYSRVAATGTPEKFETYAKGLGLWFSVSVYSHEQGRFVAVFDNITERKRTELGLRFDEQRYRSLVEATTAIVWDTPASGRFEVEQPGWTALTGQNFEELRGWGWLKAVHPDDQAETGRVWSAAVESRSVYKVEHRLRTRDGTYRHMMVRAVPVLAEDGTIRQWIGIHMDVTERKLAEQALHESEERYRALIEWSPEPIIVQRGGILIFVNPAAVRMMGASSALDLVGSPSLELVHPDSRQDALERRKTIPVDRGGNIPMYEQKLVRRDGTVIDVESQGTVIVYDGEPAIYGCMRDITERKRAEEELRWKTAFLEAQVNASLDGVLIVDERGKKLLQNERFTELLEIPRHIADDEDDEKQLIWVTGMTRDPAAFIAKVVHLNRHPDETSQDEIDLKNETVLDRYSAPVIGKDGKHYGRIWSFRDITERKRASASLMKSEQRLTLATESARIGIWEWDVRADQMGWDTQMYNLYGIREEDFSGAVDAWQKGLHPEDRDRCEADLAAALDGTRDFHTEFRVVWPGGEIHDIEAHGIVQRASDGSVAQMVGVNRDITERKRLEAQLIQSQKTETIGKLAGGIAHEFNSILTAIIGQSELLLSDLPAGSPLATNASEITKAAGRAAGLTRQLLAYGRKQLLQPEALDLNRVITSMEGVLRRLMGGKIDTRIISTRGLLSVKADAAQLEQVIMNMAINAHDAMPGGGKFTLETANVSFDQESVSNYAELKPGDYVMLAITDTGIGMSAEVKARVFEPFFSTKGVGQGTGLGLSTCYGIIKQSGGHISVYSEVARGTVFKIYLPQVEQPAKAPAARAASSNLPGGTETILLVEDDSALREMAANLLKRLGYMVLAAANGIEALSLKQQHNDGHIDLLFTDVVMPHMSGKELAERMLALSPRTRILFTSAYTENAILHQDVLNKDVAILQKPFMPSVLAHKLREVLDRPPVSAAARD